MQFAMDLLRGMKFTDEEAKFILDVLLPGMPPQLTARFDRE